jgi:hypothetical protein
MTLMLACLVFVVGLLPHHSCKFGCGCTEDIVQCCARPNPWNTTTNTNKSSDSLFPYSSCFPETHVPNAVTSGAEREAVRMCTALVDAREADAWESARQTLRSVAIASKARVNKCQSKQNVVRVQAAFCWLAVIFGYSSLFRAMPDTRLSATMRWLMRRKDGTRKVGGEVYEELCPENGQPSQVDDNDGVESV